MHKYHRFLILVLLGFLPGPACRKTDTYYRQLTNTPEIYSFYGVDYSKSQNGSTRQYHVGDTLRINGRFEANTSQITVRIGGVNAPVIDLLKKDSITHASGVDYYKTVETIRVLLTDAMGTGRLPVNVNCRGYTLNGPILYLLPKGSLPPVTDTLVWRQLMSFKPFGPSATSPLRDSFLANPVFYPSYSGTGNIYFSKKTKIQLMHPDGSIDLVADLKTPSDAQGAFSIVKMYNGAVDQQEHTLYFSAMTSDSYKSPGANGTAVDADSNWIFRFCKLDLQSKQLQVMNRTIFPIYKKNYTALGTLAQVQASYAGEGGVSQVKLPLFTAAWANNKGEVYFTPIDLRLAWFDSRTGRAASDPYLLSHYNLSAYLGKITPDGQVQYLMKTLGDWPGTPHSGSFPPTFEKTTILSFDPVKAIMFTCSTVGANEQINLYDLNSRSALGQLYPTGKGAGPTGPFNLLDAITPWLCGGFCARALGGENGRFLSMPGTPNRFVYDYMNVAYDFSARMAYTYAPLVIDSIKYPKEAISGPITDQRQDVPSILVNYDQKGNLYRVSPFYISYSGGYNFYYDVRRTYIVKHN